MALADIYVLDHAQDFEGEDIHNIYTYEALGDGTAVDLINAFQADILPKVQSMQVSQIVTTALKAYSLGNLADMSEETIGTSGGYDVDDMLPLFNAVNFTFKPVSRAVRPGSKRISGVPESASLRGTITNATYIGYIEALRTAYANEISTDEVNFYRLVVVKRVKYLPVGNVEPDFAYRFPETDAELVSAALRNITTSRIVSHQVSRGG